MVDVKEIEEPELVDSRSQNNESQFKGEINFGTIGRRTSESEESAYQESISGSE